MRVKACKMITGMRGIWSFYASFV